MKSAVLFVFLEYIIGFIFGLAGVFTYFEFDNDSSLMTGIFYTYVIAFASMFIGIIIAGYFHLKVMKLLNKLALAMISTLAGLFLFLLVYIFIESILHISIGFLSFIIPLTGGVMGFNWALLKDKKVA